MTCRILFLNPPRVGGHPVVREERFEHKDFATIYPPLTLLTTAAIVKNKLGTAVELALIDAMGFNLNFEQVISKVLGFDPHIIISRFAFDCAEEDLQFLSKVKERTPRATIIVRNKIVGDVPDLLANYASRYLHIDYFSLQDQEESAVWQIKDILENGRPREAIYFDVSRIVYTGKISKEEYAIFQNQEMPIPAYDLLPKGKLPYRTELFQDHFTLVNTSRGCPYKCSFCAYSNKKWRAQTPDQVIVELKYLARERGIKNIVFFDETISLDKERLKLIFKLMIEEKVQIKFAICTRLDLVDEELLSLGQKAGLVQISFGVESGNQQVLTNTNKNIQLDLAQTVAAICHRLRLKFILLFILGLPGETTKSIEETVDLAITLNPLYAQFAALIPFPNTPIYAWYYDNNFLRTRDQREYNPLSITPIVRTKELSYSELEEMIKWSYRKFLLRPRFLIRQLSLTDWSYNLKGLKIFMRKVKGIFDGYVR